MPDPFAILTPEQTNRFNAECVALVSAARAMGLNLCMQDLRDLACRCIQKQLKEAGNQ
jgi:hypothetical protein